MPKQLRDERSNEDGPSDGEKPLKKARYVWEVKGKHHLKEVYKNSSVNNNNNNEADFTLEKEQNGADEIKPSHVTENNNIEKNRSKPDKEDNTEGHHNSPHNSKCCNSCCIQKLLEDADEVMSSEMSNEIPLTLVTPNPKNEEYYLRKWQARQIARGFVDNTINSVLETWSNRPPDAVDIVDNYAKDRQLEDDAILMAIQSHGLQSNLRMEQPSSSAISNEGALENNPRLSEFTHDNLENFENERIKQREISSSPVFGNSNNNNTSEEGIGMEDTMDFLNAAVSVAIQKKGLSFGY